MIVSGTGTGCTRTFYLKLILCSLLLSFICFLTGCSEPIPRNLPKAEKGIIDLTQRNFNNEIIQLDGCWEFYWNQMLEPINFKEDDSDTKDTDKGSNLYNAGYVEVPGTWNRYVGNVENTGNGYATYRLIFTINDSKSLGIKIPRIFTSYKLWVNGELLASAGTVGKTRNTMVPQYLPQIALFESLEGKNEIVIQVSNFYHRSGGILESLVIGSEKRIIGMRYKNIAYEFLIFGGLIIIGAYNIAMYFFRKKNKTPLYFGLFCLFVGIRTLIVGERFLVYLFPDFSWEIAHKIQTLTFYLGVPLILTYFESVFSNAFHHKAVKASQIAGIAFGLLVLLTPARIFTIFNPAYQVFSFIVIAYIIITFIKIFIRKDKGIRLVIVGALVLILTSLNDIIFLSVWMNDNSSYLLRTIIRTGNLSSVGQLFFVFLNSLVLARIFSNAFEKEEIMTARLKEINTNLDKIVTDRTRALEVSNKKIESQKLELEKANKTLQLLTLKDPLTGLWNRRYYDETIWREWNRCLRYNRPISLLMIDIDYYKNFNDCYGHKAGDDVLVQVAQALKAFFKRSNDLIVRYGGEEFIIIMPEFGKKGAIQMALSLRKIIEDLNIPHKSSPVSSRLTVSIGVASRIPGTECSPEDLFVAVDKALYHAKNAGRNRVKSADS